MASGSRPKYDSYQSRRKVSVSSSPASASAKRPSARRRPEGSRRVSEPIKKDNASSQARAKRASRPRNEKQRLADIKRQERQRRQRERLVRRIVGITLLVIVFAALVVGGVTLANSSVFDVTSIEVRGTTNLSAQDIKDLADIPSADSLLLLNKDAVAQRIMQQPWVKDVSISKHLPHTLEISVTQRTPRAVAVLPGENNKWLVSEDTVWLGKLDASLASTQAQSDSYGAVLFDAKKLIQIVDLPLSKPRDGKKVTTSEITNAIRVINGVSPELRKTMARVSAPSVPKTKFFTKSGIEIAVGSAEDIKTKDRIIRSILKAQKGRVVLINVRAIDAPTWRGLNE